MSTAKASKMVADAIKIVSCGNSLHLRVSLAQMFLQIEAVEWEIDVVINFSHTTASKEGVGGLSS